MVARISKTVTIAPATPRPTNSPRCRRNCLTSNFGAAIDWFLSTYSSPTRGRRKLILDSFSSLSLRERGENGSWLRRLAHRIGRRRFRWLALVQRRNRVDGQFHQVGIVLRQGARRPRISSTAAARPGRTRAARIVRRKAPGKAAETRSTGTRG